MKIKINKLIFLIVITCAIIATSVAKAISIPKDGYIYVDCKWITKSSCVKCGKVYGEPLVITWNDCCSYKMYSTPPPGIGKHEQTIASGTCDPCKEKNK